MSRPEVNNSMDVIDSRNVIKAFDDLNDDYESAQSDATSKCLACGADVEGTPSWVHPETRQPFCSQACSVAEEEDYKGEVAEFIKLPDRETPDRVYLNYLFDEDEYNEWKALKALIDECEGYGDWPNGETLIRDSYFRTYAQELAEDIGAIQSDAPWPVRCINWEEACDDLQQDYHSVDFDGIEYWIRA